MAAALDADRDFIPARLPSDLSYESGRLIYRDEGDEGDERDLKTEIRMMVLQGWRG